MIGASDAREGTAGHVTVPEIDRRVIDCFGATTKHDRNEITWIIERGLGGVCLHFTPVICFIA